MSFLANDAAAGCCRVTPFDVETFDLKDAVSAMSGVPAAKLKMQAETKDEVFLLWGPGDEHDEPPAPAAAHARVLSMRFKGHDTDHRGRVDCQFFSRAMNIDPEEESPLQPGRHTDAPAPSLKCSANVVSIKVASSSVAGGFPVSLYGSVVVRDALDDEGICLFRRDRDDPQVITSQDETLLLTGPTRGLVALDCLFFEVDLKLRMGRVEDDVGFSQGTVVHNSVGFDSPLISDKLSSLHSTIELNYAPVQRALESTVQVQILKNFTGDGGANEDLQFEKFYGKISASYTSISEEIVLFDSSASGATIPVGDDGVLQLWHRVVAVAVEDSLVVTLETWGGGDHDGDAADLHTKSSYAFTPLLCGEGRAIVRCARYVMKISVVWSALYIPKLDRLVDLY